MSVLVYVQNIFCFLLHSCETHRDVGGLYPVLVGDGWVHMNQAQEVETKRRSETTQQPGRTKEKKHAISLFKYTAQSFLLSQFEGQRSSHWHLTMLNKHILSGEELTCHWTAGCRRRSGDEAPGSSSWKPLSWTQWSRRRSKGRECRRSTPSSGDRQKC